MISIISILGKNNAIGKDNKLIWNIPDDLKHFKKITDGHAVIMGRKTFESIGRPLPNRTNIIITSKNDYKAEGCLIVDSLESAISKALEIANNTPSPLEGEGRPVLSEVEEGEIFIIGGGEIYRQAIDIADKLYLTLVDDLPADADTFFPNYDAFDNVLSEEEHEHDGLKYKFIELIKHETN